MAECSHCHRFLISQISLQEVHASLQKVFTRLNPLVIWQTQRILYWRTRITPYRMLKCVEVLAMPATFLP